MKKKFSVIFILLSFIIGFGAMLSLPKFKVKADMPFSYSATCRSAYLCDESGENVIYSKNENEQLPIASMCKIMTLLLSFEEIDNGNLSLEDEVVVSENASKMGGSQVFLETNGKYLVKNLIKSIVVASANDSSVAMAERISGSEELFVEKMNEKAKELNMENTVFVNCTGLPKVGQYSTAKDVAKMYSELIKHKDYFLFSTIWMDEIEHSNERKTEISNTNKLIRFYKGCDGGKTGYTSEAKYCLAASAKRGDLKLISVVISAPDSKTRFKDASSMFDYGFANFTCKKLLDKETPINLPIKVEKGKKNSVEVLPSENVTLFMKKGDKSIFEVSFTPKDKIVAPIKKGDKVGDITIYKDSIEIKTISAVAMENVDSASYLDNVKKVIKGLNIIK
ncbi:MAG: D-alanyl-D-alanine carboxypeptidase [Clostridia bacterium]|nr:D-alanyl-D-alanine carboxypeptidase [Clostridia bacterium]